MSDVVWVLVFLIKMSLNYMHISRCFILLGQVFQLSTRLTYICMYVNYDLMRKKSLEKLPTRLLSTQVYNKVVRIEKTICNMAIFKMVFILFIFEEFM